MDNLLSSFSVNKPYTIIVCVIIIAVLGAVSLMNMSTDLLPNISLPYAIVATTYIGASPDEVETHVSRPIEQTMSTLSNIENITSVSSEHISLVIMEFATTTNMDSAMIEMRENLDMVRATLPTDVGSPMVMRISPDMIPVMVSTVAVKGQSITESSDFLSNQIVPELESILGVASVTPTGFIDNEIHVTLNQDKVEQLMTDVKAEIDSAASVSAMFSNLMPGMMPQFDLNTLLADAGISMADLENFELTEEIVAGILQGQNFTMPAGYIQRDDVSYLVRIGDDISGIEELKQLPLIVVPGRAPITLSDVTDITVVNNAAESYTKVNGNDAIALTFQKQTGYSSADVASSIHAKYAEMTADYPELEFATLMDQGEYIDIVVDSLYDNIIYGALLAILVLLFFLRDIRPTIVVGLSIPVSIVTTIVLMYFSGVTLNIISIGGLALGVGMLVDNSIVVIENIFRMKSQGIPVQKASVKGAKQVSMAITASTLTTIAVFLPIVFTQGLTREVFADMGLTITFSLIASLLVALTLVPMLASKLMKDNDVSTDKMIQKGTNRAWYTKRLTWVLDHKAIVLAVVFVLFVGSLAILIQQGTEFFPMPDTGQVSVSVNLPNGTPFERVTTAIDQVSVQIQEIEDVELVGALVGNSLFGSFDSSGSASAEIYVSLKDERKLSTNQIAELIRTKTASIDAEVTVSDSNMDLSALTGGAIVINIYGQDTNSLQNIAHDVAEIITDIPGVIEVSDGLESTAPELKVVVDKEKSIQKQLTVAQVFMAISQKLSKPAAVTTVNDQGYRYPVVVQTPERVQAKTRSNLENFEIQSPNGQMVRLGDIATIEETTSLSSINRENQKRFITVSAGVSEDTNIGIVSDLIDERLAAYEIPEGYSFEYGGEQQIILESFDDLYLILVLALILIYLIMVAQFESLFSPFIVMFSIPLGFTGGFIALLLTGNPLSVVALLGLIVLAGIVVNNGIVFIDYINILRAEGKSVREACIEAGNTRFRPIMMTALTTIFGLSTMSLGVGPGTEMIQPMAIAAIGGLIYATILTLFIVPVLFELFTTPRKKENN